MRTNKKAAILDLAYKLENAGTIPLNEISDRLIKDLQKPIRYGVLTPRYINMVLPSKYKNGHYQHHKTKQKPTGLRKRTKAEKKQEITIRLKRLDKMEDIDKILSIIQNMQKKH
jgi:hypothetical protein